MPHSAITPEYLAECLSYDPETGVIRWRERPREHFGNQAAFTTHARTKAGTIAGCLDSSTGYIVVGLNCKTLYAHRIAWAIMHGEWPEHQIDHIDGNKLNNRAANLRCVPQSVNARNSAMKRTNRSGICGVAFAKREQKWRARIMFDGRDIHCGYFATKEEAIRARTEAARKLGFHENHGRAA